MYQSRQLDLSFVLIGSYINVALFMLELVLFCEYFASKRAQKDGRRLKAVVVASFSLDAIGSFAGCALVYMYFFNHWEDDSGTSHWPWKLLVLNSGLGALLVHAFMIYRFWLFSTQILATAMLCFLAIVPFVGNICCVVVSLVAHTIGSEHPHSPYSIWYLATSAMTDLCITACLLHKLGKIRVWSSHTRSLAKRVSVLAIQTGCPPTFVAVVSLCIYCVLPGTLVPTTFSMSLGSVYACTMIYTLIRRESLRGRCTSIVCTDPLLKDEPANKSPSGQVCTTLRKG